MAELTAKMRTRAARAGALLWNTNHQQAVDVLEGRAGAPAGTISPAVLAAAYAERRNDPDVVAALIAAMWDGAYTVTFDPGRLTGTLGDVDGVAATFRCEPTTWALMATSTHDVYANPTQPDTSHADAREELRDPLSAAQHWHGQLSALDRVTFDLALCG